MPDSTRLWPVRLDRLAWDTDLAAASSRARPHAERWRLRIELAGGIPHREPRTTRAQDNPRCVKTRIPDPLDDDPVRSPWGAVLAIIDFDGRLTLEFLAFGLRHPPTGSRRPSVYERARRRLTEA